MSQSPPSKKRKLEKVKKPLSFTLPEAGLKELQVKASALGGKARGPVDAVAALLEKTLCDLRVSCCHHSPQSLTLQSPRRWFVTIVSLSAGATQARAVHEAGAEPRPNCCGEHLDPRTSEAARRVASLAGSSQGAAGRRGDLSSRLDRGPPEPGRGRPGQNYVRTRADRSAEAR